MFYEVEVVDVLEEVENKGPEHYGIRERQKKMGGRNELNHKDIGNNLHLHNSESWLSMCLKSSSRFMPLSVVSYNMVFPCLTSIRLFFISRSI
jgi:hypothetical protein